VPETTPTPAASIPTPGAPAKKPTCSEILAKVDLKTLETLETTLSAAQQAYDAENPPKTVGAYAKSRLSRELGLAHGGIVSAIQSLEAFKTLTKERVSK